MTLKFWGLKSTKILLIWFLCLIYRIVYHIVMISIYFLHFRCFLFHLLKKFIKNCCFLPPLWIFTAIMDSFITIFHKKSNLLPIGFPTSPHWPSNCRYIKSYAHLHTYTHNLFFFLKINTHYKGSVVNSPTRLRG